MNQPAKIPARVLLAALLSSTVGAATTWAARLKDIATIDVGGDVQLVGYGLVVGLDGSGDSQSAVFTVQAVRAMLERMGLTIQEANLRVKNTAGVMAVARLSRHHRRGATLDVTVSSLGDAQSLEGGTLLATPLATTDGLVYAIAQGAVSVGGFSVGGAGGDAATQNYVLVGRVPGGGLVETEYKSPGASDYVTVILHDPDFTTAQRVTATINSKLGGSQAQALDAATIRIPATVSAGGNPLSARVELLASIETLDVEPDVAARLVMNEKTGTIVAGEHVSLASVAIAHGNLSVQIEAEPLVSQPEALASGETVVTADSRVSVTTGDTGLVAIEAAANVGDLARALNALGVGPRDMIAIFQALKEAGALRAELRII